MDSVMKPMAIYLPLNARDTPFYRGGRSFPIVASIVSVEAFFWS